MGFVIDTSALVMLERSGAALSDLTGELGGQEVAIPAIVVAELLAGVRLASDSRRAAKRQAKVDALLGLAPVIEFGSEIAACWADHFAALEKTGNRIPANDLSVAATATWLGFGVLVGPDDERHFRRIEGSKWSP